MPDELRDSLDAFLIGEESPPDDDWSIAELDGLDSADRMLRRLGRLHFNEAEVRQVADAERARIAAWEEDRLAGIGRARSWVERSLDGFMRGYHKMTGTKMVKLPNGTLTLRKAVARLVADRPDETIVWAVEERDEWIKRDASPRIAEIKKGTKPGRVIDTVDGIRYRQAVVEDTGQCVPGVRYAEQVELGFAAAPNVALGDDVDPEGDEG